MGHISREARLSMGFSTDMRSMRCPRRNGLSSGRVDGSVGELRTETISFASSSVMTASAVSGEVEFGRLEHLPRWQCPRRREPRPTHSAAASSSPVSRGQDAAAGLFFLHEWRRCVCRLCTSHLGRVSWELQARLQPNRGRNNTKQAPNTMRRQD